MAGAAKWDRQIAKKRDEKKYQYTYIYGKYGAQMSTDPTHTFHMYTKSNRYTEMQENRSSSLYRIYDDDDKTHHKYLLNVRIYISLHSNSYARIPVLEEDTRVDLTHAADTFFFK